MSRWTGKLLRPLLCSAWNKNVESVDLFKLNAKINVGILGAYCAEIIAHSQLIVLYFVKKW